MTWVWLFNQWKWCSESKVSSEQRRKTWYAGNDGSAKQKGEIHVTFDIQTWDRVQRWGDDAELSSDPLMLISRLLVTCIKMDSCSRFQQPSNAFLPWGRSHESTFYMWKLSFESHTHMSWRNVMPVTTSSSLPSRLVYGAMFYQHFNCHLSFIDALTFVRRIFFHARRALSDLQKWWFAHKVCKKEAWNIFIHIFTIIFNFDRNTGIYGSFRITPTGKSVILYHK